MAVTAPPPVSFSPARRLLDDLRAQRRAAGRYPPGPVDFSLRRTHAFVYDPLPILLDAYREFGPVFTVKILGTRVIFALGPEANHFVLVSGAEHFRWREGSMGDLIPLLGDGLLTIDGAYHRRARRIMLPAFHRERIVDAEAVIDDEVVRALEAWSPGDVVDVEHWTRELALRIALRALFGLDPDATTRSIDLAAEFETALGFYGRDYLLQIMRGPVSPWATMRAARRRIDVFLFAEIARRRSDETDREDILSLLLEATDEDGRPLSDEEVRDQVMTLLFAGHDTTTATVSFLLYELARHPEERERLAAGGEPERLEMVLDETLRLYPPAWVGPRRVVAPFELHGHAIPVGVHLNYCSWASHRLPEVFPDPEAFVPDRWTSARRDALPKGAYVPFGGGSRTCIGMRFGQLEIRVIARRILERFRPELLPGFRLEIRQTPTLGPKDGLPVVMRAA